MPLYYPSIYILQFIYMYTFIYVYIRMYKINMCYTCVKSDTYFVFTKISERTHSIKDMSVKSVTPQQTTLHIAIHTLANSLSSALKGMVQGQ